MPRVLYTNERLRLTISAHLYDPDWNNYRFGRPDDEYSVCYVSVE